MSDETAPAPERIIVIPVDSSVHSRRAIEWYTANLKKPNDLVQLIHVAEPIYNMATAGIGMEFALLPSEQFDCRVAKELKKSKKLVKNYLRGLKDDGVKCQGFVRVDSRVGEAIMVVCQELKADIILIANRGEGLLRRTFLGSVSDYLLNHAGLPIVIVPPKHD